jgi:hypothetical protein
MQPEYLPRWDLACGYLAAVRHYILWAYAVMEILFPSRGRASEGFFLLAMPVYKIGMAPLIFLRGRLCFSVLFGTFPPFCAVKV